jgi:hypothetical protein
MSVGVIEDGSGDRSLYDPRTRASGNVPRRVRLLGQELCRVLRAGGHGFPVGIGARPGVLDA